MSNLHEYFKSSFNLKRPSTFVVNIKKNKDGMLDELIDKTSFLDHSYPEPSVNQRLFHFINDIDHVLKCAYCQNPLQPKPYNARLVKGGYYNGTCDDPNCRKKLNSDNSRKGCLEKYGVVNISQTDQWKEKVKKTNLERRGVEWNTQSIHLINACQSSIAANITEVTKKRRSTYIQTSLTTYGTHHPRQDADVFSKSYGNWFKKKEYCLPSGKIVMVQGYEPQVLDEIFKIYEESDVLIEDIDIQNKIGKIFYRHNNKNKRYYPDIFIVSKNKIIEVKSVYTYNKQIELNFAKRDGCILAGFDFEFRII